MMTWASSAGVPGASGPCFSTAQPKARRRLAIVQGLKRAPANAPRTCGNDKALEPQVMPEKSGEFWPVRSADEAIAPLSLIPSLAKVGELPSLALALAVQYRRVHRTLG